ncbi:SH3 domain-containing protein [Priestia aryabhattai]|uniref:SH3 domain-containing protein n=1 Tax=Priestia aryabhattai TaxID=412384 RepID=UPI0008DDB8B2|nr:SH3 domain-containing protein [Priestia aryabhattai]OHY73543.1 hypothetical protein BCV52_25815 [Priestia aryabhattai]
MKKDYFQKRFLGITTLILIFVIALSILSPNFVSAASVDSFKGKLKIPSNAPITQQYGGNHKGIDYGGSLGAPIYAAYDGKVINAGDSNENGGGYGNWIVIDHGGLYTIYGHMFKDGVLVKVGQYVKKGAIIGKVGNAGRSTGPHLHFSVSSTYPTFTYQNPNLFFEKNSIPPTNPDTPYNATGKVTEPTGFNVRNAPNATATRIGGVYKNDIVNIVAKNGDWYKIKFGTGYGYIMAVKSGLQITSNPPAETPYNATGKVTEPTGFNVRSAPNATAARIGGVYKNDIVNIVAKNGDWYKIKFGTGYGYIMAVKSGLQILPAKSTKQLKLTTTVKLYSEASMLSKNLGALAPQTVTVIEEKSSGWYKIKSFAGDAWIAPNGLKLALTKKVNLYKDSSFSSKNLGALAPQTVTVIDARTGGWYKIKSFAGDAWINPTSSPSLPTSYQNIDLRKPSKISAQRINEYIKKNRPNSLLIGQGNLFLEAQSKYGVNADYLVAHAMLESDWGTSPLARTKNNLYGQNAVDWNPNAAYRFNSLKECIMYQAYSVRKYWLEPTGNRYNGPTLVGMNKTYAADKQWASKIAGLMNEFYKFNANDYQ